jgi:hypothetical protein
VGLEKRQVTPFDEMMKGYSLDRLRSIAFRSNPKGKELLESQAALAELEDREGEMMSSALERRTLQPKEYDSDEGRETRKAKRDE